MKVIIKLLLILFLIAMPARATEFTAPTVPNSAEKYMPEHSNSFSDGIWDLVEEAIKLLQPSIMDAAEICLALIAISLALGFTERISTTTVHISDIVGAVLIGLILLKQTNSFIKLGADTVKELSEYCNLLLPVMSGALAAQGAVNTSASLYAGTTLFNAVLSTAISKLVIPMLYIYSALVVADNAVGGGLLTNLCKLIKWMMTWSLKLILYVFTGYLTISGVVSGSTDAAAVRATKLAISGIVPVVGGIISDASESILVSAGLMKGAAGLYGFFATLAIWIEPFIKIGVQYLMLKVTAAICGIAGAKRPTTLVQQITSAMGILLAMTVTMLLLILISIVCLLKGLS